MGWVRKAVKGTMRLPWLGIAISCGAVTLVVLRNVYPSVFRLDGIAVGLLVVAVSPWLKSVFKAIEIAGVGRVELADVERAAKQIEAANLPEGDTDSLREQEASLPSVESSAPPVPEDENRTDETTVDVQGDQGSAQEPRVTYDELMKRTAVLFKSHFPLSEQIADAENVAALLSPTDSIKVRLAQVSSLLHSGVKQLCRENEIPSLALSAAGMLSRLAAKKVMTMEQARGIMIAMQMLHEVAKTSATDEAKYRAIELASDVIRSLDLMLAETRKKKSVKGTASGSNQSYEFKL